MFRLIGQRDKKWGATLIGSTKITVAEEGCLISCLSMITFLIGKGVTPDYIAKQKKWFTPQGLFIWSNLSQLGLKLDVYEAFEDDAKIAKYLEDPNKFAVLRVNFNKHFVLGYHNQGKGSFLAADPWFAAINDPKKVWHNISGTAFISKI